MKYPAFKPVLWLCNKDLFYTSGNREGQLAFKAGKSYPQIRDANSKVTVTISDKNGASHTLGGWAKHFSLVK